MTAGLFVPGMKLPENCYKCYFNDGEYTPSEYEKRSCYLTGKGMRLADYKKRPKECPLVEMGSEEEYLGKHSKLEWKQPIVGDHFHGESWYRCPWCHYAFEAHDVGFEKNFKKVKADDHYGYYLHACGRIVACEWLRERSKKEKP